jgi:hypothetical protein
MKATEIRLNRPIASRPTAVVTISPAMIVIMIAPTSLTERVASHSVSSIAPSMTIATSPMFSCSVANSSSASGTSPVSLTETPCAESSESALAADCTAALAASPGISAEWSSTGCTRIRRRVGRDRAAILRKELLPRKAGLLAVERSVDRASQRLERLANARGARFRRRRRHRAWSKARPKRRAGWVGGQRAEQGLGIDHRPGGAADFVSRTVEQAFAGEEIAAVRPGDAAEMGAVFRQLRRQLHRGALGALGRVAIDDDQHGVAQLRERRFHALFLLAPLHR